VIAGLLLAIGGAALLPGRLRAGAPAPADTRLPIPATAIAIPHRPGT
jgi:hypothetical protein